MKQYPDWIRWGLEYLLKDENQKLLDEENLDAIFKSVKNEYKVSATSIAMVLRDAVGVDYIFKHVTEIPDYLFDGIRTIGKDITIPANVKKIGRYAFRNTGQKNRILTLNPGLEFIGADAFNGAAVDQIIFNGTKEQFLQIYIEREAFIYCGTIAIHCTDGDFQGQEEYY